MARFDLRRYQGEPGRGLDEFTGFLEALWTSTRQRRVGPLQTKRPIALGLTCPLYAHSLSLLIALQDSTFGAHHRSRQAH